MKIPPMVEYYSQNREDLFLLALLNKEEDGYYVDVGSNHECLHSVTKLFYNLGWSGLNIDPNPKFQSEYEINRPRDKFLNVGVGKKQGTLMFRDYLEKDGISTFTKSLQDYYKKAELGYKEYSTRILRLDTIFEENNVLKISFLKVDVEGMELDVLESNNWNMFRPKVVIIESSLSNNCEIFLKSHDYEEVFFDGLNRYYRDKSCHEISMVEYPEVILSRGFIHHDSQVVFDKYRLLIEALRGLVNNEKF